MKYSVYLSISFFGSMFRRIEGLISKLSKLKLKIKQSPAEPRRAVLTAKKCGARLSTRLNTAHQSTAEHNATEQRYSLIILC